MTAPHDLDRQLQAFLQEGPTDLPDPSFDAVRDHVEVTRQRAVIGPWRMPTVNKLVPLGIGAAAVVVVLVGGAQLLRPPAQEGGVGAPSATPVPTVAPTSNPTPEPTPKPTASPVARAIKPCCTEDHPEFDAMTFAITAPPTWEAFEDLGVALRGNDPPDGAFVGLYPGGNLYSDPCLTDENAAADVPVGPTVDDLVTALVDHPSLDVTAPVDVTLAGYSGTYLDLTVPDDISNCVRYMPMDHHIYAQGPGQRWHMWILDVDGVRVLAETNDYPGTTPETLAEEPAIVESLVITP